MFHLYPYFRIIFTYFNKFFQSFYNINFLKGGEGGISICNNVVVITQLRRNKCTLL